MTEYLDVNSLFGEELTHWRELWGEPDTPGKGLINMLTHTLWLPDSELQMPILACYMMANTKWCKCLPIEFDYGPPGTGKSTAALIASKMHDVELLSSTSTYASVRNSIKTTRYLNPQDESQENDGALLPWDNVNSSTLDNVDILNVLLGGYKRGSDLITIASTEPGMNHQFRCFCSKMISSVHPLFNKYELRELKRRLIVIFHEKCSTKTLELVDVDEINWDGFFIEGYWPLWQSPVQAKLYHSYWLKCKRLAYSSPAWDDNRKTICRDLIATGVLTGIWVDCSEAIAHFGSYWEMFDERVGGNAGELDQFIKEWIDDRLAGVESSNRGIFHSELAAQISLWVGNQQLISKPKPKEIRDAMNLLGFKKSLDKWFPS